MSDPARTLTTLRNDPAVEAAFRDAPAEVMAEILDGELFLLPRPRPRHARAASRLGGELYGPFDRELGGWVILDEPQLELGARPDRLSPDLAGWRRERMPEVPEEAAIPLAPDWVCEVLSRDTERVDRGRKMRLYRREGVRHAWLLSPELETLEVYRLEDGRWVLLEVYEGAVTVRAEPFETHALDLALLWAR